MNITEQSVFTSQSAEEQVAWIQKLQDKRQNLQVKRTRKKTTRLPEQPFKTESHKLCWLSLPKNYQKLFI